MILMQVGDKDSSSHHCGEEPMMLSHLDTPVLHRGGAYVTEVWGKQVGVKLAFTSCLSHPLSLSMKH